jgi:hypothetical protein
MDLASATVSLDVGTLSVIAICVASLLGLFLLYAWAQERIRALAWWGGAYLIGGASGALWRFGSLVAPVLPASLATILLFVAVGMIWSAAVPRAAGALGRHVVRRCFLADRVFRSRFCDVGCFTHRRKLAHRRRLYVPDRR